jgi:ribosome biogenesis protein ENP2
LLPLISNDQGTSLVFDRRDGLTLGVGTSTGHVLLYDLRSNRPLLVKEHANGLPISKVAFHSGDGTAQPERRVLSCDAKVLKIWNRDGHQGPSGSGSFGAGHAGWGSGGSQGTVTNLETPAPANDVLCVRDGRGDTGLVLVAAEQPRVLSYYVPALGPAPRWCSFLDVVTEELEEGGDATSGHDSGQPGATYDDYKFLTATEILELGLGHLTGTPLLRGYMHGFFVDARLYAKVKSVAKPFEYEAWRQAKVAARVAERSKSRIALSDGQGSSPAPLPEVNRDLAARLLKLHSRGGAAAAGARGSSDEEDEESGAGKKRKRKGKAKEGAAELASGLVRTASNPLGDTRFAKMFTSHDFEVETFSEEYKLRYPSGEGGRDEFGDASTSAARRGAAAVAAGGRRAAWDDDDTGEEVVQGA